MVPLLSIIFILCLMDTGSPIFSQERVGKNKNPIRIFKFRTMYLGTESVGTHLVSSSTVTKMGRFLRKTKLDELPQLWNVLKGEMSLVGPRPSLFNQTELLNERSRRGVLSVLPGITGLAQLSNIDMSTPTLLAETDAKMLKDFTIFSYFTYLFHTLLGKGRGDKVRK